jgi:DeoR/GlpR family transcriptional regulator of sugar metabolism
MLTEERRMEIFKYIKRNNSAETETLINTFKVSGSTIRRDLEYLASKNLIVRTHKGAVLNATNVETDFIMSFNQNLKEKTMIAKKALNLINEGDFIGLSGGTTVYLLGKEIIKSPIHNLTILTNSISTATLFLESEKSYEIILAGGPPIKGTYECVGDFAIHIINSFNLDKYFFGVNGINIEDGISFNNFAESQVCRTLINRSLKSYVIADHSKFGIRKPSRVCPLSLLSGIITDELDKNSIEKFRTEGIKII